MQFKFGRTTKSDILNFCPGAYVGAQATRDDPDGMNSAVGIRWIEIPTIEGTTMYVSDGDYIICGVEGEFYLCKPRIFKKTYELVIE